MDAQLPITNYQLPITHHPSPITNYQLPITKIIAVGAGLANEVGILSITFVQNPP